MGKKINPEEAKAAKESTKALLGDLAAGVETFPSGYGTIYVTIARANGLKFAVTPKIAPMGDVVGVYLRVRVQKEENWANLEDGGVLFGFPEVTLKSSKHASCEVYIPVAQQPVAPNQVAKMVMEQGVIEQLVQAVSERVGAAGQKLIVTHETLCLYVRNVFEKMLPPEDPKVLTHYGIAIGGEAIQALSNKVSDDLQPKQPKKPVASDENPEESDPE